MVYWHWWVWHRYWHCVWWVSGVIECGLLTLCIVYGELSMVSCQANVCHQPRNMSIEYGLNIMCTLEVGCFLWVCKIMFSSTCKIDQNPAPMMSATMPGRQIIGIWFTFYWSEECDLKTPWLVVSNVRNLQSYLGMNHVLIYCVWLTCWGSAIAQLGGPMSDIGGWIGGWNLLGEFIAWFWMFPQLVITCGPPMPQRDKF